MKKIKSRHYILLEVIIALVLVWSAFPLLSAHIYMFKSQKALLEQLEAKRAINIILAHIQNSLYQSEWEWDTIKNSTELTLLPDQVIDLSSLHSFPYQIKYYFKIKEHENQSGREKVKTNLAKGCSYYLCELFLSLIPQNKQQKEISHTYQLFIERRVKGANLQEEESEPEDEE